MSRAAHYLAAAGRSRCPGLVSAMLVLVLFVTAGAAVVADGAFDREQVEFISEGAKHGAAGVVARTRCEVPRQGAVLAMAAPRVLPRTRQVTTRGLPPPRAPTA